MTPGSEHKLNADALFVSDSMDPPTALSGRLLEPFDTSLYEEKRKTDKAEQDMNGNNIKYSYSGGRSIFKHVQTHASAKEISSSGVLCSGCPFSAGFILYC